MRIPFRKVFKNICQNGTVASSWGWIAFCGPDKILFHNFSIDHKTFVSCFFLSYHDLSSAEITSETIFNHFLRNSIPWLLYKALTTSDWRKKIAAGTSPIKDLIQRHKKPSEVTGTLCISWNDGFQRVQLDHDFTPHFSKHPKPVWGPPYPFLGAHLSHPCSNLSHCPHTDFPKACID